MSLETQFYTFLKAIPAVAAAGGGVFPVFAPPDAAAPYCTYRRLPLRGEDQTLSGPVRPGRAVFRVACWAAGYEPAVQLAAAVRAAAGVPRGQIPASLAGVQKLEVIEEADVFEPSPELLVKQLYGRYVDVLLIHSISAAPAAPES